MKRPVPHVLRRVLVLALPALTLASAAAAQAPPKLVLEIEGGPAWQSYNDVQIPNNESGTRFSLYELAGSGPWAAGRLYVGWNFNERHGIRLLLAPFSLTETGVSDTPIRFAGAQYSPGTPVEATYTFNSYRLSYRYRFHAGERSHAWVGFTGKIRDATIALEQGSTASSKDDLGFVPLLHLAGEWRMTGSAHALLDIDGLAGGPGRAVDAALKLGVDLNDAWGVRAGYRMVEGGADVDAVYTFAWLHYGVVSVAWRR